MLTKAQEDIIAKMPLEVTIKTFAESGLIEIDIRTLRDRCNAGKLPREAAVKVGKLWYIRPRQYMSFIHG